MSRALRTLLLALAAALAAAGPAHAHALLEGTVPDRGAVVERAPGQVVLRFREPVEIAFGAVRVFDAKGGQVQRGAPFHRRAKTTRSRSGCATAFPTAATRRPTG